MITLTTRIMHNAHQVLPNPIGIMVSRISLLQLMHAWGSFEAP